MRPCGIEGARGVRAFAAGVLLAAAAGVLGQSAPVVAAGAVAGGAPTTIRVWGHGHRGADYILTLMRAWQAEFAKTQPGVRFVDELDGNASAIGGLFTGAAELAVMDREASFIEVDAYQQGAGHDPFAVPVARGAAGNGLAAVHHAPALQLYVNATNPLRSLTLAQVDGIFDADHRLGKSALKTWGDVGLTGEWADKAIQMYAPVIQSAEMQFFERAAMKGSQKFSCCLHLFAAKGGVIAEQQVAAALAKDKYGVAISARPIAGMVALALTGTEGGTPVKATSATIADGTYPLARTVYMYANRGPKQALTPEVKAFLEFVVSAEGQAIVARTGGYLPLPAAMAAKAREALQ